MHCRRTGLHLTKLPQDMMVALDKVIQIEIIGKDKEISALVLVDEVAKLGLGISERTAARTLDKLGCKHGLLTRTHSLTSKRTSAIELVLMEKQKCRNIEERDGTVCNITQNESFLHQKMKTKRECPQLKGAHMHASACIASLSN